MNPENLRHEAATVAKLRADLLAQYPDLREDEQTLCDTLDGLTSFNEMIAAVVMSALDDKVICAAIHARLDDLKARADRYANREQRKRELASSLMILAELRKIERPEFTISLKASPPRTIITDETALPDQYVKIVRQPDKTAIKDALKAGVSVPGAMLSNQPETISIRTR